MSEQNFPKELIHAGVAPELVAKFFRGLGDPTRLKILELLIEVGPLTVGQLVEQVGQQQGRVSSHLACLRFCGFASSEQRGKFVYYRVADVRVRQLVALAKSMLCEHGHEVDCCKRIDGEM